MKFAKRVGTTDGDSVVIATVSNDDGTIAGMGVAVRPLLIPPEIATAFLNSEQADAVAVALIQATPGTLSDEAQRAIDAIHGYPGLDAVEDRLALGLALIRSAVAP